MSLRTCVQVLCQQKGCDRGRGAWSPKGDTHMVAARLACEQELMSGKAVATQKVSCCERAMHGWDRLGHLSP